MSEKISLLCVSGSHEKMQMAAMVAAVAVAGGGDVNVFLSMNALPYFLKDRQVKAPNEGEMGELMAAKNVPSFKSLFENAKDLGSAQIHACSMAMDVLGVEESALDPSIDSVMGLTRFLSDAADTQLMVF
ncbi:MAG: DsrE/DsrF/DrsH-like family protein [Gammaproteobacteria bacterium]|jgi:peroxiredoxin family protein